MASLILQRTFRPVKHEILSFFPFMEDFKVEPGQLIPVAIVNGWWLNSAGLAISALGASCAWRVFIEFEAGFRIRIHFLLIRIRIQWIRMEANTDPDTDPDPDPIRIQGFNDLKLKKNNS